MKSRLLSRRLWNRDFILITLVCGISTYPNSILQSLLSVYILDLGGDNAMTGMMLTGHTILMTITYIIIAPLIDRIGRKKLLVLGSGLFFLNTLLFCFTSDLMTVVVLRMLCGITTGIFFPIPAVYVADVSHEEDLVDAVGIFGAAACVAFAITPAIGLALYNRFGATVMFASAAVLGGVTFVISLFTKEHYQRPAQKEPAKKSSRVPGEAGMGVGAALLCAMLPLLTNLTINIGNSPINTFLTPCGLSRGLSQISLFFLVNQGVCVVTRLSVGVLSQRMGEKRCIFAGILLTAVGIGIIAMAHNMLLMLIAAALVGVGYTVVTQLLQAECFICVPGEYRGLTGTAYMLTANCGTGLGSSIWGFVSNGLGYMVTYALAAGTSLVCLVFHGIHCKKRKG